MKHVKDKKIAQKGWEKWCSENLNISRFQANKYITVYERFSDRNIGCDLGLGKLYLLAEFSDEELAETKFLPDGETKKLIEMSQKEIEQYKKQLKEYKIKINNLR